MSKQKIEETKEVTMEELENELVEVGTEEEPVKEESKAKRFFGKIKKPLIVGGAAVLGFVLGKAISNSNNDCIVYELDPEDDEDETNETE